MLYATLIFADCLYRAGLLARNGYVYDGMVWAAVVADTTADTSVVVDECLSVLLQMDGLLGTVGHTMAGDTSTAQIGDFIIDLNAG